MWQELVAAWGEFDPDACATTVLAELPVRSITVDDPGTARALRHLTRVRRVACAAPPGPLDFVPPQVQVLTLTTGGEADLGTPRTPAVTHLRVAHRGLLDLSPLGGFPSLRSLRVVAEGATGPAGLRRSEVLGRLNLVASCDVAELGGLAPVAHLPDLHEIRFTRGTPVNLAVFAGRRRLRVRVEGSVTKVVGAELLGPGSTVTAWDGK